MKFATRDRNPTPQASACAGLRARPQGVQRVESDPTGDAVS
ncbi:MAG TPA: hypothetical protein VLW55_28395 [Burkholderiaceae bacterium]|nr:hypothetical protein [Burkholderiaceae bacterium]